MNLKPYKKAISRREFFTTLVPVFSIPAFLWWIFTAKRVRDGNGSRRNLEIAGSIPPGISIEQGIILVNEGNSIRAYEAKCSHLGCAVNNVEGEQIVCKCHGSRFDMQGNAIRGPATEPLRQLAVLRDNNTGILKISY